jgi:muramoyltetrapeptide carboxypeptidase
LIPSKLKQGSRVRVVAPARSIKLPFITSEIVEQAEKRLRSIGLDPSFGKHVNEINFLDSSSISSRVEDLHDAFSNPDVAMIQTVIGGYNSRELLPFLDYELIRNNPKILVGYSDITALANAIYAKTGLVTYSGPHFFSFGEKQGFDHTLEYFKKCVFESNQFDVLPSEKWSDDRWGASQDQRNFSKNEGYAVVNKGEAKGRIIGGNLVTLTGINGSLYFPYLETGTVLFLEEDHSQNLHTFNANLDSLMLRPDFDNVVGMVFGRFESGSGITVQKLMEVLRYHDELDDIPIICGADFGHTTPLITFPIGGTCKLVADSEKPSLSVLEH